MDASPRTESAARTLLDEGISWLEASQFDKATSAFAEAASIASQEGNALLEARAYANIGTACASRYDHHAAVDMYKYVFH
jgi:Flp pilus assembly protein TadD